MVVLHGHARLRGVLWSVFRLPSEVHAPLVLVSPGETHVDVCGIAIAVELPVARHVHGLPCRVVEVNLVEVLRALVGVPDPVELPRSLEREVSRRFLDVAAPGLFLVGI